MSQGPAGGAAAPARPLAPAPAANGDLATVPAALRRVATGVSAFLVALDLASLALLLWTLDLAWSAIVPLALAISVFTGYELQWRYLLSPGAYRAAGSKARFLAAAAVIVAVNLGASTFLVLGMFHAYLGVRAVAAAIGGYAWTRWQLGRVVARASRP